MTNSTIGSGRIATAFASHFTVRGIAIGVANAHLPESIEAMAKQLGAQVAATCPENAQGTELMILAVPFHGQAAFDDQPSGSNQKVVANAIGDDGPSPDEIMGILNSPR